MAEEPAPSGGGTLSFRGQSPFQRRLHEWRSRLEHLPSFSRRAKRETPERPRSPRNQRRRRIFYAIVVLVLAYPVLGTLALWSGLVERVVRSEDLRVELANPSYTIWPGRIHVKHARILANGDTQFILDAADLLVNVRMLELFERKVHVTELAARDVRYQMRVQVDDTKGIEQRVAAYPPLTDIPGAKTVREKKAEQTEPREADWTVQVEGLDVNVAELWFFEYRYLGKGRLRGGFLVGPQVMSVTTAVQDLGPGELRFGPDQVVATNLRGQITANIPTVNPEEHADASFLELVESRVNLRADVQSLVNVGAYVPGIAVSRGRGPLALDAYLEKGLLGMKSFLQYDTESVRVKGLGFGVETDWHLRFDASGEHGNAPTEAQANEQKAEQRDQPQAYDPAATPRLRSSSKLTYASIAKKDRAFTVHIQKHEEEAVLDTIYLSKSTDLKRASVRMPSIRTVDLDDLAIFFPDSVPFHVEGGEARASAMLEMDGNYRVRGPVRAILENAKMNVGGIGVTGTTTLNAEADLDLKNDIDAVEKLHLSLRNFAVKAGDADIRDWWLDVKSDRLALSAREPARFDGTISVRAKDLEPVLEGLAAKDQLSGVVPALVSLDDFRCKLTVHTVGEAQDIIVESESDVWDASGRVYSKGDDRRMAVVVGGQAVSLGVASFNGRLELMPFAKTGWLNEHLRKFPEPVRLPASKP